MKNLLFAFMALFFISAFAADEYNVPGESQNIESESIFEPCDCVAPAVVEADVFVFERLDVKNPISFDSDFVITDSNHKNIHDLCLCRYSENNIFTSITTQGDWLGYINKGMPVDDTLFKHQHFKRNGQLFLYS